MSNFARIIDAHHRAPGPLRILAASGQLGYGVIEPSFREGLSRDLHLIGADMGSVDPGPYYLGAGKIATAYSTTKRDLRMLLNGALTFGVPLIIGTAGTGGGRAHLAATVDIVRQIAGEDGLSFRLATIDGEIAKGDVVAAVDGGRVAPIGPIGSLTVEDVNATSCIVGQMGVEAFLRAMEHEPDVIIAGRACDTAIYASLPARLNFALGPALQMAKIIECASLCCEGGGRDAMLGTLEGDSFVLESMTAERRATPMSVAAHALYEQADPWQVVEPEGVLHLADAKFDAVDDRRCRVSGGRWEAGEQLTVKIEGATRVGSRAVYFAGSVDPVFIANTESIAASVEAKVRDFVTPDREAPYQLSFRFYGLGAVSGQVPGALPEEIGVLVECIANSPEEAHAVVASAKQYLLHATYPDRISTAGNLAFPFTPPEIAAGDAYKFSVYHVMQVDALAPLFPVAVHEIGR